MGKNEMQQILEYTVINECLNKIRKKCRSIYLIGAHDSDIMELNKLTRQYLDLIKLRGIISHIED